MSRDTSNEPAEAQKLSVESCDQKTTVSVDHGGDQLLVGLSPVDGLNVAVAVGPGVSRDEIADALAFIDAEVEHVRSLDPTHTNAKDRLPTDEHDTEIEAVTDGGVEQ